MLQIVSAVGFLPCLHTLSFRGCTRLKKEGLCEVPFRELKALRSLDLAYTCLTNLGCLEGVDTLTKLVIAGLREVVCLAPVQASVGMMVLDISGTGVVDLTPITAWNKLEVLGLANMAGHLPGIAELDEGGIAPLYGLPSYKGVTLASMRAHRFDLQFLQFHPACYGARRYPTRCLF